MFYSHGDGTHSSSMHYVEFSGLASFLGIITVYPHGEGTHSSSSMHYVEFSDLASFLVIITTVYR